MKVLFLPEVRDIQEQLPVKVKKEAPIYFERYGADCSIRFFLEISKPHGMSFTAFTREKEKPFIWFDTCPTTMWLHIIMSKTTGTAVTYRPPGAVLAFSAPGRRFRPPARCGFGYFRTWEALSTLSEGRFCEYYASASGGRYSSIVLAIERIV